MDATDRCDHPLSSIEWRHGPDWARDEKRLWHYGFCMECGASVEVEYQYDNTTEIENDV